MCAVQGCKFLLGWVLLWPLFVRKRQLSGAAVDVWVDLDIRGLGWGAEGSEPVTENKNITCTKSCVVFINLNELV